MTAQIREAIIIEGRECRLAREPLEGYFTDANPKPDLSCLSSCSACWRGYHGTWDIEANRLRLIKLSEFATGKDLWKWFMKDRQPPVDADWYTGVLRIERGEMLWYIHGDYLSVFERDEYIVVVDGKVLSRFEVTNDLDARQSPLSSRLNELERAAPSRADRGELPWLDTLGLQAKLRRKKTARGTIHLRGLFLGVEIYLPGNGLESESRIQVDPQAGANPPEVGAWVEAQVTLTEAGHGKMEQFRILGEGEFLDRRAHIPVPTRLSAR